MPEIYGKRELFAREYLKDLNASAAAVRAGYSSVRAGQTGHELLRTLEVADRIAELAADRSARLEVDTDTVLRELLRMLQSDPADLVNEDGTMKPLHEIPLDARRAIASIETSDIRNVDGEVIGRLHKVKFWNKERAAEMLARHLSLFADKITVDIDGLAAKIVAARDRSGIV